jgi:uncharacterized protein (TIGR02679 family)
VTNGPIDIRALYAEPGLRRLFEAARERLERRDLDVGGWVTIREPSADERRAIARTLGAPTLPYGDLRVSLADLDATLRAAAHGLGLPEVLAAMDRPLVARKAAAAQRRAARTALYEVARSHPALVRHPGLEKWLDWIRARGLLSRLSPEDASGLLDQSLDVLNALPVNGVPLPVLAGRTVGSTHALDRDQPLAQLCERALAILAGRESIDTAAERRDLWAGMGVSLDAVSSTVLVLGLRPVRGPLAGLLGSAAAAGEPLPITLRMLRDVGSLELDQRLVRICENRSIIEAAADELGAKCPPLVCTSGDPTLAGRRLLEVLAAAGADLRYHGDFDWEGIGIANGVVRAGVRPWRYDADAYLAAVSQTPIRDSLGDGPVRARWDGRLVGAMLTADARIYEEHVLGDLLADLAELAAAVEVPGGLP